MLVNGRPATTSFIRKTSYVPQEDNFIATMSGQETMRFHADIVLPQGWTKKQRRERVAEVRGAVCFSSCFLVKHTPPLLLPIATHRTDTACKGIVGVCPGMVLQTTHQANWGACFQSALWYPMPDTPPPPLHVCFPHYPLVPRCWVLWAWPVRRSLW
jgi:hypothetical protein